MPGQHRGLQDAGPLREGAPQFFLDPSQALQAVAVDKRQSEVSRGPAARKTHLLQRTCTRAHTTNRHKSATATFSLLSYHWALEQIYSGGGSG